MLSGRLDPRVHLQACALHHFQAAQKLCLLRPLHSQSAQVHLRAQQMHTPLTLLPPMCLLPPARMLKYTPEHMHCMAVAWGPLAPPNTGVLAVQRPGGEQRNWRVSATGVVLQLDAAVRIVKKLKLVGTPFKVGGTSCSAFAFARIVVQKGCCSWTQLCEKAQAGGHALQSGWRLCFFTHVCINLFLLHWQYFLGSQRERALKDAGVD